MPKIVHGFLTEPKIIQNPTQSKTLASFNSVRNPWTFLGTFVKFGTYFIKIYPDCLWVLNGTLN